jgi:hypothetical protein
MRNSFGILTAWLFPLRKTRAVFMLSSRIYSTVYTIESRSAHGGRTVLVLLGRGSLGR